MEQVAFVGITLDAETTAEIKRRWRWFVAFGAALVLLGTVALAAVGLATLASVVLFGWLLACSGVAQLFYAWGVDRWRDSTQHLVGGPLSIVVGVLIVTHPAAGAASLTLLLAALFTVSGVARVMSVLSSSLPARGWALVGGFVTLLLGILLWVEWPLSGMWAIGTFVGIDLIFDGCALVATGVAVRRLPG
jgi:uncharacterized membrane protein HdeD (DUF308 family)